MDKINYLSTDGTQAIVDKINENQVLKQDSKGNISSRYVDKDGNTVYNTVPSEDVNKRNALALGGINIATEEYATAVGGGNTVSGYQSTAIGIANTVTGKGSIAIGYRGNTSGNFGVFVGLNTYSTENPRYVEPTTSTSTQSINNESITTSSVEFPTLTESDKVSKFAPLSHPSTQASWNWPKPSNFTEPKNIANNSAGESNVCIGNNIQATGIGDFVIGRFNIAEDGTCNYIQGRNNRIFNGFYHSAEGYGNTILSKEGEGDTIGSSSHVEGCFNTIYNTGDSSHVEGYLNTLGKDIDIPTNLSGPTADQQTYGSCSHVEGVSNTVTGGMAHAEGYRNTVEGNCAHAEGHFNKALNRSEHACGQYNLSTQSTDKKLRTLFSIGNGNPDWEGVRHNAVEVKFNGDIYIQSKTTTDKSDLNITYAPMKRLQTWLNEKQDTQKFEDTSDASITLKPNVYYNITITDAVTLTLEKPTDETVSNVYQFCFDVDTSVPKITFPTGIMWEDTTTLLDSSHYEYTIRYVKGTYYGSRKRWAKQL